MKNEKRIVTEEEAATVTGGDVTSANVVGYAGNAQEKTGSVGTGATFQSVGGDASAEKGVEAGFGVQIVPFV